MWINISAFLARLFNAEMFGVERLRWASRDISEGLEKTGGGNQIGELIQKCRTIVAT